MASERAESGVDQEGSTAGTTDAAQSSMRHAINKACAIIERADERNLANDGPAGGSPPQMSLPEWRSLYVTLDRAT
jgi:hypothetical protein